MTAGSVSGDYEIVVIGGALVGGVLALALANLGKKVALVDARSLTIAAESASPEPQAVRTTAIAAGSVAILDALVPQLNILSLGSSIHQVHVSQQGFFGVVRLSAEEEGVPALGYVVENRALQSELLTALASHSQVTMIAPAAISDISQDESSVTVLTDRGELTAQWLIGVDGVQSAVRHYCDIPVDTTD